MNKAHLGVHTHHSLSKAVLHQGTYTFSPINFHDFEGNVHYHTFSEMSVYTLKMKLATRTGFQNVFSKVTVIIQESSHDE